MKIENSGVIIVENSLPWGVCSVRWYMDGQPTANNDTNVSDAYVHRVAAQLGSLESIVAICESQPGSLVAHGSSAARDAFDRIRAQEIAAAIVEASRPWRALDTEIRVHSPSDGTVAVTIDGETRRYAPSDLRRARGTAEVLAIWAQIHQRAKRLIELAP